jgi:alkylated DNA nucleotide flippase Atl1
MSSQDDVAQFDEQRSLTIAQFCALENISVYTYYKIRKMGYGPRELRVPGTEIARITPESRRKWHALMESREVQEQAKREFERRAAQSAQAGAIAAASANNLHPKKHRKATVEVKRPRGRPRKHPEAAE